MSHTSQRGLSHPGLTVDERFTWQTAKAVRAWQKDNGLERTGRVDAALSALRATRIGIVSAIAGRVAGVPGPCGPAQPAEMNRNPGDEGR
jgi:peptidoglycan hydrolase-like protein with peptidoglycan-binding domain